VARKNTAAQIIEQATKLFRNSGYHATSMNDIAQSVGLKKASLYNHFPSKEEIARAVVKHVTQEFQQHVFDIAKDGSLSQTDRAHKIADFLYQQFTENRGSVVASLSMGELDDKELPMAEIRSFVDEWQSSLVKLLVPRLQENEARCKVQEFVACLHGGQVMMRLYNERRDLIRKACDEFAQLAA